jgi:Holliday junction resolvase
MNAKRKGTRNEHRTIKFLEEWGFRCTRSGGSLGVWDIIAVGQVGVYLVQVKTNRKPTPKELAAMQAFKCPGEVAKVLVIWRDRQREPECWRVPDVGEPKPTYRWSHIR